MPAAPAPKQPPPHTTIEKPDTLDAWRKRVDAKLKEGETFFFTLQATVQGMASSQAEMRTDVRELRGQMSNHEAANANRALAEREDLAAVRSSIAVVDGRLDEVATTQAEQGAQIGHLSKTLDEIKAAEIQRDEERKAQGEMLRRIDTALTARAAVEADRAAVSQPGDSPPLPSLSPTHPNLPALPPRRVPLPAVVGGVGGVGMAVVAAVSNSPVLQWGVVVVAAILAFGWALRGRAPSA